MLCMCAYFKHQSSHVLYLHHFSSVLVTCHFNIKLTEVCVMLVLVSCMSQGTRYVYSI